MRKAYHAFQRWRGWHERARALARLGASPGARIGIYVGYWVLRHAKEHGRVARPRRLRLRYRGRALTCEVGSFAELYVVREVFLNEEYALDLAEPPRVIFDLGANIGASVLFFHARYPEARIHAFEPDPAAFARLERNVGHIDGVVLRQVAVAGEPGRLPFHRSEETWTSSLIARENWNQLDQASPQGSEVIEVEAASLEQLMHEAGVERIDLVKMDVEGAEWAVLPTFSWSRHAAAVVGELHLGASTQAPDRLFEWLADFDVQPTRGTELWTFRAMRPAATRS